MRVTNVSPDTNLCEEGNYRAYRATNPYPGLSAIPVEAIGHEIVYQVETGGPQHRIFIPPGTHTPVQVQARVARRRTTLVVRSCAVQYVYGDRTDPVPDDDVERIVSWVRAFVAWITVNGTQCEADRRRLMATERRRRAEGQRREVTGILDKLRTSVSALDAANQANPLARLRHEHLIDELEEVLKPSS